MGHKVATREVVTLLEEIEENRIPVPEGPLGTRLPAVVNVGAERRLASLKGAAAAGIPALAMIALVPLLYHEFFPLLWYGAYELSRPLAPYLALVVLFATPALLALPVAVAAGRMARRQAEKGKDLGMAAAAGAGIACTGVTVGAILRRVDSFHDLVLMAPLFAAASLAVGLVGSFSFAALRRRDRGDARVPALYRGCVAAGVGGPALLVGGGLWALAAAAVPALSPRFLASLVGDWISSGGVEALTMAIALGGLAPVSFLTARFLRGSLRGAGKAAVFLGLMFPILIPLFGVLGIHLSPSEIGTGSLLMLLTGCLAGAAPHAVAIVLGLRGGATRERRALEGHTQALPA